MRIPVVAIILLQLIAVGTDSYIRADMIRLCKRNRTFWIGLHTITSLLLWAFIIVTLLLPRRDEERSIMPVMWMLYAWLSIYIPKIIYCIFSLIGLIPRLWRGKRLLTGKWIGIPLACVCFAALWYGALWGRYRMETVYVNFESENVPPAFDGFRIAQISDLHVGTWGTDTVFVSRLVDSVNNLKPDLIVFTGDIVNRETCELRPFAKVLQRLRAPYGVYSILGNHDYGDYMNWHSQQAKERNLASLLEMEKGMGWKMLNNSHKFIVNGADTLVLVGVENWGEPPFHQYGDLDKAYPLSKDSVYNVNDRQFKILLTHNPEHWRQIVSKTTNFDLSLSGHTHAMQITIGAGGWRWSPAAWKYANWGGMYTADNGTRLYVNIGAGEVGMPARIGATPEITLFTLHRTYPKAK